jgi:hypothetical protein
MFQRYQVELFSPTWISSIQVCISTSAPGTLWKNDGQVCEVDSPLPIRSGQLVARVMPNCSLALSMEIYALFTCFAFSMESPSWNTRLGCFPTELMQRREFQGMILESREDSMERGDQVHKMKERRRSRALLKLPHNSREQFQPLSIEHAETLYQNESQTEHSEMAGTVLELLELESKLQQC